MASDAQQYQLCSSSQKVDVARGAGEGGAGRDVAWAEEERRRRKKAKEGGRSPRNAARKVFHADALV